MSVDGMISTNNVHWCTEAKEDFRPNEMCHILCPIFIQASTLVMQNLCTIHVKQCNTKSLLYATGVRQIRSLEVYCGKTVRRSQ